MAMPIHIGAGGNRLPGARGLFLLCHGQYELAKNAARTIIGTLGLLHSSCLEEDAVMSSNDNLRKRESVRIILDPPTFSPPAEMRREYLGRRAAELEAMLDSAKAGEWKPVINIANHVRGTGAMYGFGNIGLAAENLVKAVQNGDPKSLEFMDIYAQTIRESYV